MKMIVDLTREDFDYELEKVHRLRIIGQKKQYPNLKKSYINLEPRRFS